MIDRVERDLRTARLARDTVLVGRLSLVLDSLRKAAKESGGALDEQAAIAILRRERKRRGEAAESFRSAGREEDAAREEEEAALIDGYLPATLADDELAALVRVAIAEAGATSVRDLGAVMKLVTPRVAGRADGRAVSTAVRAALV